MYKKYIQGLLFAGIAFTLLSNDVCAMNPDEATEQQKEAMHRFRTELNTLIEEEKSGAISKAQFESKFHDLIARSHERAEELKK